MEEMLQQRLRALLYERRKEPSLNLRMLVLIAVLQVVILVELLIK